MVDFSFIGREGLIIQWDDVIAMIGYNVARYLKSKGYKNDKLCEMSNEDILLSYINRPNEDPAIWLKENFDIEFDLSRYKDSIVTWQPNWAYPYRIIKAANDNKLQNLCIYYEKDIPIISSMGTGNKLDPTKLQIAYIEKTSVCPLAKVMRTELKKRGIKKVKVLYSEELPLKPRSEEVNPPSDESNSSIKKRQSPGSISFVPPVAGMIIGGEVIKDIIGMN